MRTHRIWSLTAAALGALALVTGPTAPAHAAAPAPAHAAAHAHAAGRRVTAHADDPYVMVATERYGPDPLQYVQVLRSSVVPGPRPTAYFIHGGSWVMGSPSRWDQEAKVWAERGWTVVNVSYRLDVNGRLMEDDIRTVTEKYRRKAYVDSRRQLLVGDSAGGQLATLIAAKYPSRFRGVVAWSPVVSPANAVRDGRAGLNPQMVQLGERAARIWGYSDRTTTALSYVSPKTPPLWVAASQDEWVPWTSQGALLCAALGSRCRSYVMPGSEHGSVIASAFPALEDASLAWAESTVGI